MTEPQEITAVWGDADETTGHEILSHRARRRRALWSRVVAGTLGIVGIGWFFWASGGEQEARGDSAPTTALAEEVVPQLIWEFDSTAVPVPPSSTPGIGVATSAVPRLAEPGTAPSSAPAIGPPVSTVVPTAAPNVAISVQAEDPGNLILGGAQVTECATCSGGHRVAYIGPGAALVVRVTLPVAGPRVVTIVYEAGGPRLLRMTMNGTQVVSAEVNGTDWETQQTLQVTIALPAGAVELRFDGDLAPAPDLDRVAIG